MNHSRNRLCVSITSLVIVLFCTQLVVGQVRKRVVPFPEWSRESPDEKGQLELVEIRSGGKPIKFGEPFEADSNWLQDLTLTVRNVGKKPIEAFGVGGGLLEGLDEELPGYASFQYGVTWNWGSLINREKGKPKGTPLKPGATVVLTYDNVDQLTREVLSKPGEGVFCKLKLMSPSILYAGGKVEDAPWMTFRASRQ